MRPDSENKCNTLKIRSGLNNGKGEDSHGESQSEDQIEVKEGDVERESEKGGEICSRWNSGLIIILICNVL